MVGSNYLSKIKFLVIDGNAFSAMLIQRILAQFGAQDTRKASDGADAMTALKTYTPDIIIVDWLMKPVDGMEFSRWLREGEDSPDQTIPIIMASAYSSIESVNQARDVGINEFVIKPISPKSLITRIQRVIELPRGFVRSENFFGPDRRRGRYSTERRTERSESNDNASNPAAKRSNRRLRKDRRVNSA